MPGQISSLISAEQARSPAERLSFPMPLGRGMPAITLSTKF
jgi:hypothetical protein